MDHCIICQRGRAEDPLIVYEDDNWIVRHSRETNILGYLLIESRRHFLDLSESTDDESLAIGPLLKRVTAAIKSVVQPERVYTVTLAETVPHCHIHVIPRDQSTPRAYRGRGILAYPLQPGPSEHLAHEVCTALRRRLRNSMTSYRGKAAMGKVAGK